MESLSRNAGKIAFLGLFLKLTTRQYHYLLQGRLLKKLNATQDAAMYPLEAGNPTALPWDLPDFLTAPPNCL